jgi:phage terminase large subunit-like protein
MLQLAPGVEPEVRIVRGSSLDNAANQDPKWVARQRAKRGTRVGRQEVDGELLSPARTPEAEVERMDDVADGLSPDGPTE